MTQNLGLLIAEFALIAQILMFVLVSVCGDGRLKAYFPTKIIVPCLLMTGLFIIFAGTGGGDVFEKKLLVVDALSQYSKVLILMILVACVFLTQHGLNKKEFSTYEHRFDYFPVAFLSVLGIFVMVSANDLMAFYLGLELQSLALYILIAFKREQSISTEASLKYLVLGALGTGLFLFGTSLVYGLVGSVQYQDIYQHQTVLGQNILFVVGATFIIMALFFKMSAVPFHMWTPDVYQGSPSFVTAFVATLPKIAVIVAMIRLLGQVFMPIMAQLQPVLWMVAVLSLIVGSVMAVKQNSIYRMAAYSTITHMGYILLGLGAGGNYLSIIEYMTIYAITNLALFGILASFERSSAVADAKNHNHLVDIADLAGLHKKYPLYAVLLTIVILSLAGIPPLAGFFVKFSILSHLISSASPQGIYLAVIAVLASCISAFYYLRVLKVMYFDESQQDIAVCVSTSVHVCMVLFTSSLLMYIIYPQIIKDVFSYFTVAYGAF